MGKYKDLIRRAKNPEEQCQTETRRGQCLNAMMPDSRYCPVHGGNRAYSAARKQRFRMYQVERYQKRIEDMQEHEGANSFREEIAVLRMMLATRLESCKDDHDLMMHSQLISNLVTSIEKAVTSALKLEKELGKLLTEDQAAAWTTEILEIICTHVEDPDLLEAMANEIDESLERVLDPRSGSSTEDLQT